MTSIEKKKLTSIFSAIKTRTYLIWINKLTIKKLFYSSQWSMVFGNLRKINDLLYSIGVHEVIETVYFMLSFVHKIVKHSTRF